MLKSGWEIGINKQMYNLFNEFKETLMSCVNDSSKKSSSRFGQLDRKLVRLYSIWSSKIQFNIVDWRWRIFNDGKLNIHQKKNRVLVEFCPTILRPQVTHMWKAYMAIRFFHGVPSPSQVP